MGLVPDSVSLLSYHLILSLSILTYNSYFSTFNRMISFRFQGNPFNITVIQVYAPTSNAEEAEIEWFYEDL